MHIICFQNVSDRRRFFKNDLDFHSFCPVEKRSNTHFNENARHLSTHYTIFTAWFMLSAISRYVTLVLMVTQVLLRYMN